MVDLKSFTKLFPDMTIHGIYKIKKGYLVSACDSKYSIDDVSDTLFEVDEALTSKKEYAVFNDIEEFKTAIKKPIYKR